MSRGRLIFWVLGLGLILGLGAVKSAENRRLRAVDPGVADRAQARVDFEARLSRRLRDFVGRPGAQVMLVEEFHNGKMLKPMRIGGREFKALRDPASNQVVCFKFVGNELVGHFFVEDNSEAIRPLSIAETIRVWIAHWGVMLCGLALAATFFAGKQRGLAAEAGVAVALATIVAWLVAPPSMARPEAQVIVIVVGMITYLACLGIWADAAGSEPGRRTPRPQFAVRTLLAAMAALSLLLALGMVGYWMTCLLALGGLYFYAILSSSVQTRRVQRIVERHEKRHGVQATS